MAYSKNPDEMDYWENAMFEAAKRLPGAHCTKCNKQLEPQSISDDPDEMNLYGFNGTVLELIWVTYIPCCLETAVLLSSWEAMIPAYLRSLIGDK